MPPYVPLHIRSAYSLGRGPSTVEAVAERAAVYGHDAVALTDRNNLYGAIPFIAACRRHGVRPILGAEVDGPEGRVVLLVESETGYANLCRLITARHLDAGFTLTGALLARHAGLHVLVDDAGLLERLAGRLPHASLWGELAAPAHGSPAFGAVLRAAGRRGLRCVATGAVNHVHREEHAVHTTLAAIRTNTVVGRLEPGQLAAREAYFKAPAAMTSIFRGHPGCLANTRRLAERCTYLPERTGWIFPDPPIPDGAEPAAHLRGLCEAGLTRRFRARPPEALRRLERELAVIERLGFTTYFVVVGEIMRFARERGIASVGRGSGAGSLTAYLLGITNVDPLRYGLFFERFLHEKRPDCPDLDIDLCWIRRDEVIEHVYATYGRDRVAMISTHNTFQSRSAFRETAKAHGVSHRQVNRLAKCVPHYAERPLRQALDAAPRGREIPRTEPPWPRVLADTDHLLGLPRHLGLHPGGIVISDRPLAHYVPLEQATKGIVCTQYEMRAIEQVGLVKIDLLGNRALSTIQETVDLVHAGGGDRLDPDTFAHDDPATARLLGAGDTLGVFQMESPAMRGLNRMLGTRDLDAAIAAVALIRPGPAGSGMKERFVRRLRGEEAVTHADPRLEPILRDTFGIPLYEEHVMCLAAETAGLALEDGDVLRRALAARTEVESLRSTFLRRARRRGYSAARAEEVWSTLARFGAFAFCKAHAAGYGVLAWQAAWLKAHHPLEYACAIMNHHAGMYAKRTHLEDAKRRGVRVRLPDVNRSPDRFGVEGAALRVGLDRVRGLTAATQRNLIAARERRPFSGLEDFLLRVPAARAETEALVLAGAFDFTGRTRPTLLCVLGSGYATLRRQRASAPAAEAGLFAAAPPPPAVPWTVPVLGEFTDEECAWLEWAMLGLCVGEHPMRLFRRHRPVAGTAPVAEAGGRSGPVRVAGLVAARRTVRTEAGRLMQFVTLEDESGMVEGTLFPDTYDRHRGRVRNVGPYVAEGRMESQYGACSLNVERITAAPHPASLRGLLERRVLGR